MTGLDKYLIRLQSKLDKVFNYIVVRPLSSLAWALGSWVRIPLDAWMSAFILFVWSCAGSGLATGWSPICGVLPTVLGFSASLVELNWTVNSQLIGCPVLSFITNLHRPQRKRCSSIVASVFVSAGTSLPSRCSETTICLFPYCIATAILIVCFEVFA
jgi:hypothetical protein